MRRTEGSCQYGLQYLTHPRELEDDEMIEIAKLEEPNHFGESNAFYKLYNTAKGAVFFFENLEKDKVLVCLFEMVMENLYIVGEPKGASQFSIELKPGQSSVKMLKPLDESVSTSI